MDAVMPIYNPREHSIYYARRSLWQYHKDNPSNNIADFESIKLKAKITVRAPAAGNNSDAEVVV